MTLPNFRMPDGGSWNRKVDPGTPTYRYETGRPGKWAACCFPGLLRAQGLVSATVRVASSLAGATMGKRLAFGSPLRPQRP